MFEFWSTAFLFFLTEVFAVAAIHSLFEWHRERRAASADADLVRRLNDRSARQSVTSVAGR